MYLLDDEGVVTGIAEQPEGCPVSKKNISILAMFAACSLLCLAFL